MNNQSIVEPLGTCPLSGYPLLAVHHTTGHNAGLALADVADHPQTSAERLRLEDIASREELIRSWTELLLFTTSRRWQLAPERAELDHQKALRTLKGAHHYDAERITASVHVSATEHVHSHSDIWQAPGLAFVPDVGITNMRVATTVAIQRLCGPHTDLTDTIADLHGTYLNHLAT